MGTGGSVASKKIHYLQQASYLRKRLQLQLDQLAVLYELAQRKPSVLDPNKTFSGGGVMTSANEERLVQCLALEEQIRATSDSYNTVTSTIRDALYKLDDTQQQLLLEARYLNDLSWNDCAELLGLQISRTFQLHRYAIRDIVLPV